MLVKWHILWRIKSTSGRTTCVQGLPLDVIIVIIVVLTTKALGKCGRALKRPWLRRRRAMEWALRLSKSCLTRAVGERVTIYIRSWTRTGRGQLGSLISHDEQLTQ